MRIGIIGGGIAGLSSCYFLQKEHEVELFEKEKRVGGACKSVRIKDYVFDYGPHVLHSNGFGLEFSKNLMGGKLKEVKSEAFIYLYGYYTRYPFGYYLKNLPLKVRLECLIGLLKRPNIKVNNFREWIYSNFGYGFAKHFHIPQNEKKWKYDLSKMDFDWVGFIPKFKFFDVFKGAFGIKKKEFDKFKSVLYPKTGGIESFIQEIRKKCKNIKVESEVKKIRIKDKVELFVNNKWERYDRVISTLPLTEYYKVMKLPREVERACKSLVCNSIVIVNIGLKEKVNEKQWIYFPEEKFIFDRVGFYDNFSGLNKSSIGVEISVKGKIKSKKYYKERVINDLIECGILKSRDLIEVIDVKSLNHGFVIFDLRYRENVWIVHEFLLENNIIPTGKFGLWRHMSMLDCVEESKKLMRVL